MNTRRQLLKQTGAASAALTAPGTSLRGQGASLPAPPKKTIRIGFSGVGVKGSSHIGHLLRMEGVELRAVCDIVDLQCREEQEQAFTGFSGGLVNCHRPDDAERCTRKEAKPAPQVAAVLLDMAKKTLARPATLKAQMERMLADLHSERFVE